MFDTRITHISYYIPENRVSVDDIIHVAGDKNIPTVFSSKQAYVNFLKDELKVDTIRVEDSMDDRDMLTKTVEQIFVDGIIEPDEIDLIILAQEEDQRQQLNLGQFIQYEFELKNAYILNVCGNHCANTEHAFTLASQIACNNSRVNNILILGNVKIKNPVNRLVGTYGIISDASGAMLLQKHKKGLSLKDSKILSAGRFYNVNLNRDDSLILCKYYVKTLKELLQQADVSPHQVKHIITQNANSLLTNQCLEMAGLDTERIFIANQTKYAHMDSLDFLVNLKDLSAGIKDTNNDELILSFGTGWAGSYIASLLSYN